MPKDEREMQSWRVFFYARKYLGRSVLYAIFGKRHARTVDGWCEDPRFTDKDERAFDPIQGVRDLLGMLDDQGHCGVVRACIAYLVSGTSMECKVERIVDPKSTIGEEILADYRAVADMQAGIEAGLHPDQILAKKDEAIAEVERTYAKYHRDFHR